MTERPLDPDGPLQRTDLQDTAPHIHRRMIELLLKMTPEERIQLTSQMMESIRHLRQVAGDSLRPGGGFADGGWNAHRKRDVRRFERTRLAKGAA